MKSFQGLLKGLTKFSLAIGKNKVKFKDLQAVIKCWIDCHSSRNNNLPVLANNGFPSLDHLLLPR